MKALMVAAAIFTWLMIATMYLGALVGMWTSPIPHAQPWAETMLRISFTGLSLVALIAMGFGLRELVRS